MESTQSPAYLKGFADYQNGKLYSKNPYTTDPAKAKDWNRGWTDNQFKQWSKLQSSKP